VNYNGTPVISLTAVTSPGAATTRAAPLNVWIQAAPGVQLRYEDWKSQGNNEDTVTIVRFDLKRVHIKIKYQPLQPMSISDWIKQEQAIAVINGGYFDEQNHATGLVISDGQVSGTSYAGFGGMLSVDAQGHVNLRSLRDQPYDPDNEQLQQAMQSTPMLMLNGKRTQFNANAASSRRSIVATDKQGRLLLIASPGQAFSLDELADLLASSDLSINSALNLDGGASTGLYMNAGSHHVAIDSLVGLPLVIVVK
jgi:exopolysaccharide biosynthesis protein